MVALPARYLRDVWNSRFARDVALVTTGTVVAQTITIGFAPLITRIYGPEAFGLWGTFSAMVAVVIPLAALAYPIAIVLPRDDRDALALVRLCVYLAFAISALFTVALWLGGDQLVTLLGIESISGYMLLVPAAMLFSAGVQVAQQWLMRKKEFGAIAGAAVGHSLILNSAKTGIGWFLPLAPVLIVLATMGYALHAGLLALGARKGRRAASHQKAPSTRASMQNLAHRHSDFPIYRAPQNFINAASQSMPVLMLAALFGPAAAGFYTLSKTVMGLPSTLVGKSVSDVFYPRITEAAHYSTNLTNLILHATGVLALLGCLPFGLVVVFGPWIFGFVFGSEWAVAGEYARWMALFFFFNFINKPSVASVPVLGIQRGLLIYEIFSTGGKVTGLLIGFYIYNSDVAAVALFSTIGVVAYAVMISWVVHSASIWDRYEKPS